MRRAWQPAPARLFTRGSGGLPTRRRLTTCPTTSAEFPFVGKLSGVGRSTARIRRYRHGVGIGFEQPDLAALVVIQQLAVLLRTHVAGPDNRRTVDVGAIVDPLFVDVVARPVAHDHEMASAFVLQALGELGPSSDRARRAPRKKRLPDDAPGGVRGPQAQAARWYNTAS